MSAIDVDVVIIGAGISGLGAAYRITERNPGTSYVILEQREQLGGTWDLFRYPGVRSDSSIFTLCFPWEPWTRKEGVADGVHIREYLNTTAHKYGIDQHIEFNTHVRSADWDSSTDTWTVNAEHDGAEATYRGRFVFFGSGYYNYDEGYTPDFPGLNEFGGAVVHPQHWLEDLDHQGKKIVVIGSGATAMSLIPALAEKAAKVTMLQRSPTYIFSGSRYSAFTELLRKILPRRVAHSIIRQRSALLEGVIWFLARKTPGFVKWLIRQGAVKNLPEGYDVDTHFKPRYNPWDQRLCLIPDADLYAAISDGRAEVVTDHIDHFDSTGIVLTVRQSSGRRCRRHRHRSAAAGARRSDGVHRRRRDQAAGPLRLQGPHARGRAEPVLVRRLHQRLVDAARRHDRPCDGKAAGAHEFSRLHARLPASGR